MSKTFDTDRDCLDFSFPTSVRSFEFSSCNIDLPDNFPLPQGSFSLPAITNVPFDDTISTINDSCEPLTNISPTTFFFPGFATGIPDYPAYAATGSPFSRENTHVTVSTSVITSTSNNAFIDRFHVDYDAGVVEEFAQTDYNSCGEAIEMRASSEFNFNRVGPVTFRPFFSLNIHKDSDVYTIANLVDDVVNSDKFLTSPPVNSTSLTTGQINEVIMPSVTATPSQVTFSYLKNCQITAVCSLPVRLDIQQYNYDSFGSLTNRILKRFALKTTLCSMVLEYDAGQQVTKTGTDPAYNKVGASTVKRDVVFFLTLTKPDALPYYNLATDESQNLDKPVFSYNTEGNLLVEDRDFIAFNNTRQISFSKDSDLTAFSGNASGIKRVFSSSPAVFGLYHQVSDHIHAALALANSTNPSVSNSEQFLTNLFDMRLLAEETSCQDAPPVLK